MTSRILLAALAIAGSGSFACAQSSTATSGTNQPMTTAPTGATNPNGSPKWMPPPAARSGEKGLPTGPGAATDTPLEVKRKP